MIAAAGAVEPLMRIATFANDWQKLNALGTLDVLEINNPKVRQQLDRLEAAKLLQGLNSMGSGLLREQAGDFYSRLSEQSSSSSQGMTAAQQMEAARKTRIKYDGVRHRAMRMMQGWDGDGRRA